MNKKKATDAFGNKLKTKKEAIKAREAAMAAARSGVEEKPVVAIVNENLEGADDVLGTSPAFHLLAHVAHRILQILKGDFLRGVRLAIYLAAPPRLKVHFQTL